MASSAISGWGKDGDTSDGSLRMHTDAGDGAVGSPTHPRAHGLAQPLQAPAGNGLWQQLVGARDTRSGFQVHQVNHSELLLGLNCKICHLQWSEIMNIGNFI